eukprot:3418383-Prymnesium_polylepis.2
MFVPHFWVASRILVVNIRGRGTCSGRDALCSSGIKCPYHDQIDFDETLSTNLNREGQAANDWHETQLGLRTLLGVRAIEVLFSLFRPLSDTYLVPEAPRARTNKQTA